MKIIIIKYKPCCEEKPWLVVRENGEYKQHAHLRTKQEALKVRNLIDRWVYKQTMICCPFVVRSLIMIKYDWIYKNKETCKFQSKSYI